MQLDLAAKQAAVAEQQARAQKTQAEAQKVQTETQFIPMKMQAEVVAAATNNLADDPTDKAFQQRLELTDRLLKEKEIEQKAEDRKSNERITMLQMAEGRRKRKQDGQTA
jgi:hypothetical protein